jgi:hypothetical protein
LIALPLVESRMPGTQSVFAAGIAVEIADI